MGEKLRSVLGPCCLCLAIGLALGLFLPGLLSKSANLEPAQYAPASQSGVEVRLDLNCATAEQLQELPGIGPALAGRILEYREKNGPFRSPWELTAVSGLGEATVSDLLPYVTVSEKEK